MHMYAALGGYELMHSWEGYFGVYSLSCKTMRKINTKIILCSAGDNVTIDLTIVMLTLTVMSNSWDIYFIHSDNHSQSCKKVISFMVTPLKHMMMSPNGNIFRVTGHLCGEFTSPSPAQRPVTWSFDVFLDLRLNKRLSKGWWGWLFEMLSCPLWCHRNATLKVPGT